MDLKFVKGVILQGDVLERLANIPDGKIDCIISSPPYWGLRDYGVDGQLGLEPDFRDYLKKMSKIMTELKRVLKKTGTCWINLGDTYGYEKGKSRFGIPERFYIQCIDEGWIARNHIPWYKANSMPSSVKDRFTNKWESIFFFAKNQKYYFNLDAVREKTVTESKPFNIRVRENITGHAQAKLGDKSWTASEEEMKTYNKNGTKKYESLSQESKHRQGMNDDRGNNLIQKHNLPTQKQFVDKLRDNFTIDSLVKLGLKKSTVEHWFRYDDSGFSYPSVEEWKKTNSQLFSELLDVWYETDDINPQNRTKQDSTLGADGKPIPTYAGFNDRWKNRKLQEQTISRKCSSNFDITTGESLNHPKGKNPGDVFFINPRPFSEAHFATFPVDLPLKILKCACPPDGIVLDPFFGAGTVAVAAQQLDIEWMGIELSEEYIEICKKRLSPSNKISLTSDLT